MTLSLSLHGKRLCGAAAGLVLLATIHASAQGALPSQQQTPSPSKQEEIDFRAERIDLKTQERLLDFLNQAQFPEPIARALGVEKQVAAQILAHRRRFGPFGYRRLEEIRPFWQLPQRLRDRIIALFGPAVFGEWHTLPYDLQRPNGTTFSAAHSAMLHTGKVLFFPEFDSTETLLWDPTNEVTPLFSFPDNQPGNFLFCSGHSFLSDGRLLAVGGGGNFVSNAKNTAWKFDPDAGTNGTWQQTSQNMAHQRWYPTAVTLGYPYVLVAGGVFGSSVQVTKLEIYNEANDTFAQANGPPASPTAADHEFPETYPGLHLLPSGKILYTHTGFGHGFLPTESRMTASYLELTSPTIGSWTAMTSEMTYPDRTEGMSVQILGPELREKARSAHLVSSFSAAAIRKTKLALGPKPSIPPLFHRPPHGPSWPTIWGPRDSTPVRSYCRMARCSFLAGPNMATMAPAAINRSICSIHKPTRLRQQTRCSTPVATTL